MQNTIYHWIPVSVLAEIAKQSPRKLKKLYRKIIQDDCVPLNDIPRSIQDIYVSEYLLRDRVIDFSFLDAVRDYSTKPLFSPDVQSLFREMQMMRRAYTISQAFASSGTVTAHLRELASEYHISYSTLARRRALYMNSTPLYRALSHSASAEDTKENTIAEPIPNSVKDRTPNTFENRPETPR